MKTCSQLMLIRRLSIQKLGSIAKKLGRRQILYVKYCESHDTLALDLNGDRIHPGFIHGKSELEGYAALAEDMTIRDTAAYQNNNTVTTPDAQWQVKSEFNVTLSAWNRSTVAGCFCTYRRMVVYVAYYDTLILRQNVLLGFGVKPRKSRPVVVEVKGEDFPVEKEWGQLLEAELRNTSSINLQFYFHTRVMLNDKKATWMRLECEVVAKTPLSSSEVGSNLLWKSCKIR